LGNTATYQSLYIHVTVHCNRPTRRTNYPILFRYKTLHVSGIFSAQHQEFSTVHSALVSFVQIWWPLPSKVRMELQFHHDSAWKRSKSNLHLHTERHTYTPNVCCHTAIMDLLHF